MKTKLLFLSTILFSFSISAQIDFEAHTIVDSHPDALGPISLISADIDSDGDKDILTNAYDADKIVWFENLDGQGTFSEPRIITSNIDYPVDITVADIDNDGNLDVIAVLGLNDRVSWFENIDGLGNFSQEKLIRNLPFSRTVEAKDIDGDGDIDIVSVNDLKVIWLENMDGLGTFGPEKIVANYTYLTYSLNVNDLDADGDMDILMADNGRHTVTWYKNTDGQGIFGPEIIISSEAYYTNTAITSDIDKDGDLDVVSVSNENYNSYVAWFENTDGLGNFGTPNIIASDNHVNKLFATDIDSDGDDDIIATIPNIGRIIWLENDGVGNFGEQQFIYLNALDPLDIIADDFNDDGKMDVASTIYGSDKIIWFENKGPLSIEENTANLFSLYPNPTTGLLTINSSSKVSEITVYNNLGQLLFTSEEKKQIDISTLSEGIYFVKIKDQNGQIETNKVLKK
ncbi:MAG: T9SS type A sorting domain-containing protein [Aequorivita sp.]|nr:T9SS type A sorting domain-containing protein [Aequorivita sp.]